MSVTFEELRARTPKDRLPQGWLRDYDGLAVVKGGEITFAPKDEIYYLDTQAGPVSPNGNERDSVTAYSMNARGEYAVLAVPSKDRLAATVVAEGPTTPAGKPGRYLLVAVL